MIANVALNYIEIGFIKNSPLFTVILTIECRLLKQVIVNKGRKLRLPAAISYFCIWYIVIHPALVLIVCHEEY